MQQKALECWNVLLTFNETRAAVQKTFWQTEETIYCKNEGNAVGLGLSERNPNLNLIL